MSAQLQRNEHQPPAGLPEVLPEGEILLWQGKPTWRGMALRVFHIRLFAIYFAALLTWRVAAASQDGSLFKSLTDTLWLLPLPLVAIGLPALLAYIYARTTTYTITNRRAVLGIGAALPFALNLPFNRIGTAGAKVHKDGSADITLSLLGTGRVAYLHLWPHARPWRLRNPEPMMRSIPDGERVASLLASALESAQPQPQPPARAARIVRVTDAPEQLTPAVA